MPRNVPLPAPADTAQPPLARAHQPRLVASDSALRFDRAELFATGALTLQDLLERVVNATPISAGYLASPSIGAVAGDARRIRVFIDGLEWDALDPRSGGILDLSQVPLWTAEEVAIERSAVEIRVRLRSWRVDRKSPFTRTDIATGDQQTNLYRAFYGKRFEGGGAIQVGAQQYSTTPPRDLGSSADQLAIIARVGWARPGYSVDAVMTRLGRNRGDVRAFGRIDSLRGVESTRNGGYVRASYRDADTSALWAQVIASATTYNFKLPGANDFAPQDTIKRDTTTSQRQYLLTVGTNRGGLSAMVATRVRQADSTTLATPIFHGSWAGRGLVLRATVEGESADSMVRADVAGEFAAGDFARVGAAADRIADRRTDTTGLASQGVRAWAGLRLRNVWIDAGVIRRDSAVLAAPGIIGAVGDTNVSAANGLTLSVSGRVWRAVSANLSAIRWNDTASLYRPKYQTRSELFVRTSLLSRFPTGNFGFLLSARHEYRSATLIPAGAKGLLRASGERSISTLLEIRIYTAVLSWQLRNIEGARNYQAPDYQRPRTVNFYGVRWEFWN